MIKIVGYSFWLLTFSVQALVPVEGIIMGQADPNIQADPLLKIFSDIYDKTQAGENKKIKLYESFYHSGQYLNENCTYLIQPTYSSSWQEKQVKRSMVSTLQYVGLDTTIKAIGAYARKLDIEAEDYKRLTNNLIKNYCSKNITIFSLKKIEKSLSYYYENPLSTIIPSVESSPFATEMVKISTEKPQARSREFDLVIKNFRAFCSWGGEVEDYRMLNSYLNNRFIMSFVIKNILGYQDKIETKQNKVVIASSPDTVQVGCSDLVCRKEEKSVFDSKFPLSVGSTGMGTDLQKLYCHHFRFQDAPKVNPNLPQITIWLKEAELEDPIFETSQFISLMTGVPDLFNGVETYRDVPLLVRSSIDERWNLWSREVLGSFSKDLLYEESLEVKIEPRPKTIPTNFGIDFSISMGEMDRILKDADKLSTSFELHLTKNYMRELRTKWIVLLKEVDTDGQKAFHDEVAEYINAQLKQKQKLFTQKMWNEDFSKIIAEELVQQALFYQGPLFDTYDDTMLKIPIKFTYGLFALGYIKFRGDLATGRLKLNL